MAESAPTPTHEASTATTSAARMYAVVVGVGIVCALAIVTVYESTKPIIRQNTIEFRNQAILDVLPAAQSTAAFRLNDAGQFESTSPESLESSLIFAGYDENNNLVGLAIEAHGMGYQDIVRVLYGYSLEKQAVVGIAVIQSRETPGVGDRIETDENFLRNFEALDVRLNPQGDRLAHAIEFVKPDEKSEPWQIDGISGATISTRAIAKMLGESAAKWVPIIRERPADFQFRSDKDT